MTASINGSQDDSRINPVLQTAYKVLPFSNDVTLNHAGIHSFATSLADASSSTSSYIIPTESFWATEPLHPIPSQHDARYITDWIFNVSLLNFSFWSDLDDQGRYAVQWKDAVDGKGQGLMREWTGYWSLPAALNRALEEGIDATSPQYWTTASDAELSHIFRASPRSKEQIPLLETRIKLLREAGEILVRDYQGSFYNLLRSCGSEMENGRITVDALKLVQKVVDTFPAFQDEAVHPQAGKVYLWKRPQILVAELWAAFESVKDPALGFPVITGISNITMFADYRVPQILHFLDLITYSPSLLGLLENKQNLPSGSELEINLRALSIIAVEELRKEVSLLLAEQNRIEDSKNVNAVLLDFWLWNKAKELEAKGQKMVQCHRTRSIWY